MNTTGEKREKGSEEIFEVIIADKFPRLMIDTKSQKQEAQITLNRRNTKNNTNKQ